MTARLASIGFGFGGGFFAAAAMSDGANGWTSIHVGIALACTAAATLSAALR